MSFTVRATPDEYVQVEVTSIDGSESENLDPEQAKEAAEKMKAIAERLEQ